MPIPYKKILSISALSLLTLVLSGCSVGFVSFGAKELFKGRFVKGVRAVPVLLKLETPFAAPSAQGTVTLPVADCKPVKLSTYAEKKDGANKVLEPAAVHAKTAISFGGLSGGSTLFSDEACMVPLEVRSGVPVLEMKADEGEVTFYVRTFTTEQFTVKALAPGFRDGERSFVIAVTKTFVLTPSGETQTVGLCKLYTLAMRNLDGTPASDGLQRTISISGLKGGQVAGRFFADLTSCNAAASISSGVSQGSVTLNAGAQSVSFAFRITEATVAHDDTVTLQAMYSGMGGGSATIIAKLDERDIKLLASAAEAAPTRNEICNGPVDITVHAASGRQLVASSIKLESIPNNGTDYYSDPTCGDAFELNGNNLSIPAAGRRIWYRETTGAAQVTISGKSNNVNNSGQFAESAAASKLVANLSAPLSLVNNFGTNGIQRHMTSTSFISKGWTMQGAQLLAVGSIGTSLVIRRYNSNGTFDKAGPTVVNAEARAVVYDATAVGGAGAIYVAGVITTGATEDFLLVKYSSDLNTLLDFEQGEFGATPDSTVEDALSLVQVGSRVIVVGKVGTDAGVIVFNKDSLNIERKRSFKYNGTTTTNEARGVVGVSASEVIIGGTCDGDLSAVRYNFTNNNFVGTPVRNENVSFAVSMAGATAQGATQVVMGGTSSDGDLVFGRFNNDASIDLAFGGNGSGIAKRSTGASELMGAVGAYPDLGAANPASKKLFAVGSDGSGRFFVQRFAANGSLDPEQGPQIRRTAQIDNSDFATGGFVTSDLKIYVAGSSGNGLVTGIVRYDY